MQYEVEVNGRLRQVHVHRVDGRFVVAVDGSESTVDAVHVDSRTLSLLIEEPIRLEPDPTNAEEVRLRPDPTDRADPTDSTDVASGFSPPRSRTHSYEVTIAPDPASGGLIVQVGETPLTVAINGRRRWGRREEAVQTGTGPQRIVAPMPGKVVRVLVNKGEAVHARQPVVVIEAMKMENELRAASDGTLAEIHVRDGQSVDAGALLVVIQR